MPTRNQRTPAKVIKEDLKNGRVTDSLKYLQGQKYVPETYGLLSFHKNADRINTLKRFYPHEPVVNNVRTVYNSLKSKYYSAAITTTAVSWYIILYLGLLSSNSLEEEEYFLFSNNTEDSLALIVFSDIIFTQPYYQLL